MNDQDVYNLARQRINQRTRRLVWRRIMPLVTLGVYLAVMGHPTIAYTSGIESYSPELKVFMSLIVLPYLVAILVMEWRERAIAREVARIQAEGGVGLAEARKAKRAPSARLAEEDEVEPVDLDELLGGAKPKRRREDE